MLLAMLIVLGSFYCAGVSASLVTRSSKVIAIDFTSVSLELSMLTNDIGRSIIYGAEDFNIKILNSMVHAYHTIYTYIRISVLKVTMPISNTYHAICLVYRDIKLNGQVDIDLTESTHILSSRLLSDKDIQKIYKDICLPVLTEAEKGALLFSLGVEVDAIRYLLVWKGIIELKKGNYYMASKALISDQDKFEEDCRRVMVHENSDSTTVEEEEEMLDLKIKDIEIVIETSSLLNRERVSDVSEYSFLRY